MKNLSECKICRSLSNWLETVSQYSLGTEHNVTVGLFTDDSEVSPVCYHRFQGHSRHNLLKILAIAGMVAVIVSVIRGMCCLIGALVKD